MTPKKYIRWNSSNYYKNHWKASEQFKAFIKKRSINNQTGLKKGIFNFYGLKNSKSEVENQDFSITWNSNLFKTRKEMNLNDTSNSSAQDT